MGVTRVSGGAAVLAALLSACVPNHPEVAVPGYLRSRSPKEIADDLFAKAAEAAREHERDARWIAGEAYLRAGYRADAERALNRVFDLERHDGALLAEVAALYVEAGMAASAARFWDAARATATEAPGLNLPLAAAAAATGDPKGSEEYWLKVKDTGAPPPEVQTARYVRMGAACLRGGDVARAERFFDLATTVGRPDDGLLLIAIGAAYLRAGMPEQGGKLVDKGFGMHRPYEEVGANLAAGAAYASVGDASAAEPFFRHAVEAATGDAETYLAAGAAYAEGGDDKKAEEYLGRALSLSTKDWRRIARVGAAWLALAPTPDAIRRGAPAPAAPAPAVAPPPAAP